MASPLQPRLFNVENIPSLEEMDPWQKTYEQWSKGSDVSWHSSSQPDLPQAMKRRGGDPFHAGTREAALDRASAEYSGREYLYGFQRVGESPDRIYSDSAANEATSPENNYRNFAYPGELQDAKDTYRGYGNLPYVNEEEDAGSISYVGKPSQFRTHRDMVERAIRVGRSVPQTVRAEHEAGPQYHENIPPPIRSNKQQLALFPTRRGQFHPQKKESYSNVLSHKQFVTEKGTTTDWQSSERQYLREYLDKTTEQTLAKQQKTAEAWTQHGLQERPF